MSYVRLWASITCLIALPFRVLVNYGTQIRRKAPPRPATVAPGLDPKTGCAISREPQTRTEAYLVRATPPPTCCSWS
jgi:hypothetical protein